MSLAEFDPDAGPGTVREVEMYDPNDRLDRRHYDPALVRFPWPDSFYCLYLVMEAEHGDSNAITFFPVYTIHVVEERNL